MTRKQKYLIKAPRRRNHHMVLVAMQTYTKSQVRAGKLPAGVKIKFSMESEE